MEVYRRICVRIFENYLANKWNVEITYVLCIHKTTGCLTALYNATRTYKRISASVEVV